MLKVFLTSWQKNSSFIFLSVGIERWQKINVLFVRLVFQLVGNGIGYGYVAEKSAGFFPPWTKDSKNAWNFREEIPPQ